MDTVVGKRVTISGDGWCGDEPFFIILALWEVTGLTGWKVQRHGVGPQDNRTDGETDHYYRCTYKDNFRSANRQLRLNANRYSYQSVYQAGLKAAAASFGGKGYCSHCQIWHSIDKCFQCGEA